MKKNIVLLISSLLINFAIFAAASDPKQNTQDTPKMRMATGLIGSLAGMCRDVILNDAKLSQDAITYGNYEADNLFAMRLNKALFNRVNSPKVQDLTKWPIIYKSRRSPNGQTFAHGSPEGVVYLINTQTGTRAHLHGHTEHVYSMAFSPDGKMLASGGSCMDCTVRLWDTATGDCRAVLQSYDPVFAIAFSPDGQILTAVSPEKTERLWRIDYTTDLIAIEESGEIGFLLAAAEDWLATNESGEKGRPHLVTANNPIYLGLIERFPYLNDPRLFTVVMPNENGPTIPTCSSSEPVQPEVATPAPAQGIHQEILPAEPIDPEPIHMQATPSLGTRILRACACLCCC